MDASGNTVARERQHQTGITIRRALPEERPSLADRFAPCLHWMDPASQRATLADTTRKFMVAEIDGETVGLGGYGQTGYTRRAFGLGPAVTLPEARGLGVGTALVHARLHAVEIEGAAQGLTAVAVHVASKRPGFWHGLGFQTAAVVDGVSMLCAARPVPMALDRAKAINLRVVNAFWALDGAWPSAIDLSDITMEDAATANSIMHAHPGDRDSRNGSVTYHLVVDPCVLPRLARFMASSPAIADGQGAAA